MRFMKANALETRNHDQVGCVELDAEVLRFTDLLVGERASSEDDSVELLRRDMRRERNKAVRTILRVIRSDLHTGKPSEEVAQFSDALSTMIRQHSRACVGTIESEIASETDIECLENPLEIKVLRGDESPATFQKLGRVARNHIQKLQGLVRALNERQYGVSQ